MFLVQFFLNLNTACSSEIRDILKDKELQKLILNVDGSAEAEKVSCYYLE